MKTGTRKALYDIHSAAGIFIGLAIFVVCVSGAIAVFKWEIDLWVNPEFAKPRSGGTELGIDDAVARFAANGLLDGNRIRILVLPTDDIAFFTMLSPVAGDNRRQASIHVEGGPLFTPRRNHIYFFLRDLHVRLFLRGGWGRLTVGIIGLVMVVSVVSGVLIHKHIFRDILLMRWGRSLRVELSDLHKLIGVWAVLFHFIIALTGAWLGLEGYLNRGAGAVAEAIDPRAAALAVPASKSPPRGTEIRASYADLIRVTERHIDGIAPAFLRIRHFGTDRETVTVHGVVPGQFAQQYVNYVEFRGADPSPVFVRDVSQLGFVERLHTVIEPLHYGYFGGFWVKLLYFVLGLTPGVLALSGALIWFDRTRRKRNAGRTRKVPGHA